MYAHSNVCVSSFLFGQSLRLDFVTNASIDRITSINSKNVHINIFASQNITISNIKISAPGDSPNTDGIHVQGSSHVTITGASIKTGDDCISIGPGTTNLWIEQVNCGPGHGIR